MSTKGSREKTFITRGLQFTKKKKKKVSPHRGDRHRNLPQKPSSGILISEGHHLNPKREYEQETVQQKVCKCCVSLPKLVFLLLVKIMCNYIEKPFKAMCLDKFVQYYTVNSQSRSSRKGYVYVCYEGTTASLEQGDCVSHEVVMWRWHFLKKSMLEWQEGMTTAFLN